MRAGHTRRVTSFSPRPAPFRAGLLDAKMAAVSQRYEMRYRRFVRCRSCKAPPAFSRRTYADTGGKRITPGRYGRALFAFSSTGKMLKTAPRLFPLSPFEVTAVDDIKMRRRII